MSSKLPKAERFQDWVCRILGLRVDGVLPRLKKDGCNQIGVTDSLGRKQKTYFVNNEPFFCLSDVCNILGLRQGDVRQRLEDDERTKLNLGRQGEATFVNESGLYSVVLRSDKPNAKPFRKWVTSEVLFQNGLI